MIQIKRNRIRSPTGENAEDEALNEGMFYSTNLQDAATETWGTIRGIFGGRKSKGTGWEVYEAASLGQDKLLGKLLDRDTTPQDIEFVKPTTGNTPLHKAAKYGHSVCVFLLIYANCKIDRINKEGEVSFN